MSLVNKDLILPVEQPDLIRYIPQREPIIMINRLVSVTEKEAVTEFTISNENIFLTDSYFNESGLLENMAQTAAAGAGWYTKKAATDLSLSYIGAVDHFNIYKYPVVGQSIETHTEISAQALNITLIKARTFLSGVLIAECEMKVVSANAGNSGLS